METRPIGRSGLRVPPLCFGGNVFGWTADERDLVHAARRLRRGRLQPRRHRRRLFALGAGQQGRRVRDDHRQLAEAARQPRPGRDRDQGRHGDGRRQEGPVEGLHPARPPRTRCERLQTDHIDLYQSHQDDPATPLEETLEAFAELIKAGQGPRHRRLELHRRAPRRGAGGRAERTACRATRCLQPQYNLYDRADFEADLEPRLPRERGRRHPLLLAGQRLPHRQVPLRGRPRPEPARPAASRSTSTSAACASSPRSTRWRRSYHATPAQVALAWLMARPASPPRSPAPPRSSSSTS